MTYFGTRLSDNLVIREPEGYLLCLNVAVARTGAQDYLPEELGLFPGDPGLFREQTGLPASSARLPPVRLPPIQKMA